MATTTLAYRALSEHALASSGPNRAWTLAAKAILTDSSCYRCYDVLAAAYFAGGEATKAVRAQRSKRPAL